MIPHEIFFTNSTPSATIIHMKTKTISSARYNLIDVIRAVAIISMIAYHLCYDIFVVFEVDPSFDKYPLILLWERSICFTFIIISGVSLNFSRHPFKRGIIVNLCGFAVTAVTLLFMPSQQIWFGILNLIGCGMLLTAALRRWLDRLHPVLGMTLSLTLYALTAGVPYRYIGFFSLRLVELPAFLYGSKYLSFIGFMSDDFFYADFFPLIPWLFLFLFGNVQTLRNVVINIPALSFIGRHSLVIYLVHQPLLYTLCALIFGHF